MHYDDAGSKLSKIGKCYNELRKAKNALPVLENSLKITKEETRKIRKAKSEGAKSSKILYGALVDQYADILNPVDWENLDLIIFYFETGRADTMQDALKQVDRQRQADAIVDAINEASERICNTITYGFQKLESTVIKCATVISKQLENINENQQLIMSGIISTNNALNALKEQANTSSH